MSAFDALGGHLPSEILAEQEVSMRCQPPEAQAKCQPRFVHDCPSVRLWPEPALRSEGEADVNKLFGQVQCTAFRMSRFSRDASGTFPARR